MGALILACGSGGTLAPATSLPSDPSRDVAVARSEGVTLAASAHGWPGSPRAARRLTPIRVEITNETKKPLYGAVADIHLIAGDKELPARAPDSIEIDPQRTTVGKTAADFDSRTGIYEFRQPSPAKLELNRQIRMLSLPEGAIESGESVQGFVYFNPLPPSVDVATLRVQLRDGPAGPVYATLDIPFARQH